MAKVYLSEYMAKTVAGVQAPKAPPLVVQTPIAIGGGAANSAAFNGSTELVRISVDAVCSIRFGTNPTATANDERWAANQTEWRAVAPGDQISVITNT